MAVAPDLEQVVEDAGARDQAQDPGASQAAIQAQDPGAGPLVDEDGGNGESASDSGSERHGVAARDDFARRTTVRFVSALSPLLR